MGLLSLLPLNFFYDLPIEILCVFFTVIAILSTILYFNLDSFNKSLSRKERKEADIAPSDEDVTDAREKVGNDGTFGEEENKLTSLVYIDKRFVEAEQNFEKFCVLTFTQIKFIESLTRDQANSCLWHSLRVGRITSSNIGSAISLARRDCTPSVSFMKSILKTKDISHMPAVKYGVDNENYAIQQYEEQFRRCVVKCGIYFHSCGFLGGSPDGLIESDGIVEVKCPYRLKDAPDNKSLHRLGYLKMRSDLKYEIVRTHKYFHQIQGNLYFTERSFCDFIIWAPKIMICIRVDKDPIWEENLTLLKEYYVEKVCPKIKEFYASENIRGISD